MNLDRALKVHGWMSGPELQFLAETASKAKNILEIGSYQGRSTVAMVDNSDAKITCVDPWDGKQQTYGSVIHTNGSNEDYSRFYMNLYGFIGPRVTPIRTTYDKASLAGGYDFIFIDAIHEYEALKKDIVRSIFLMNDHAILAGHDYCDGWPGVKQAVDEIFPHRKVTETIWWVKANVFVS